MKLINPKEFLNTPRRPSSEERLLELPVGSWTPEAFAETTRDFLRETGFSASISERGDALPPLGPDVRYKYSVDYNGVAERIAGGANLLVAVVMEGERVIGYGIAYQHDTHSEIEIIDVDERSRRFAGLQRNLTIDGAQFGVGVGHVVTDLLAVALKGPILVDATSHASRYICKSLGFVPRPGEQNPCLLHLPVNSIP